MSTPIKSGASSDLATVGATNKAIRAELYGPTASPLALADRLASGFTPGTTPCFPLAGIDYKTPRALRAMSDGSLAQHNQQVLLYDNVDASNVNTNIWLQTTTTQTIAQASGVITFNSGSSVATTTGALHSSQRTFVIPSRGRLLFRSRQRHTAHFNNSLIELGFSNTTSATTSLQAGAVSGALWQKDGTGQYIPTLAVGGSLQVGTAISNATLVASVPATDYATFEVELDGDGATFRILTSLGVLVNEQRLDFAATLADLSVSHFNATIRHYNSAGTGTAVQVLIADTAVLGLDLGHEKPWSHQMAGAGYGWYQSPVTTFGNTTNYTNQIAPTTRTVANTTAQEATLGGHVSWNSAGTSFAGSDTVDLILFSQLIPAPFNFFCTGLRISTVNLGAANAAAPYTIEYSLAVGSNAVTLATAVTPNGPRFIPLGVQTLAASAAIGIPFDRDTIWTPQTPVFVPSGRFIQLVGRVLAGTATASQVIRTIAAFDGYFE